MTTLRYVVAIVEINQGEDETLDLPDCRELVACRDEQAVRQTTLKAAEHGHEWAIFELVDGRFVRRSITVTETVTIS